MGEEGGVRYGERKVGGKVGVRYEGHCCAGYVLTQRPPLHLFVHFLQYPTLLLFSYSSPSIIPFSYNLLINLPSVTYPSLHSFLYLSLYISNYCIYPSVFIPTHQFILIYLYLSIYLSIYLSNYLS